MESQSLLIEEGTVQDEACGLGDGPQKRGLEITIAGMAYEDGSSVGNLQTSAGSVS